MRVCRNCSFFALGAHGDCREPAAELVVDKERANYCEYFAFDVARAPRREERSEGARAALDALFRKA